MKATACLLPLLTHMMPVVVVLMATIVVVSQYPQYPPSTAVRLDTMLLPLVVLVDAVLDEKEECQS